MRKLLLSLFSIIKLFSQDTHWAIYYGNDLQKFDFSPYSLIVLEGEHHHDLNFLLEDGKTLLGYLSIGEISNDRPYFKEVEKEGALLTNNPNWPDSYFVDIRNKAWTKRIISELIPNLLFQRYSGIFLDTVDSPLDSEAKYPGMRAATINLIKSIRFHFPKMPIMMNRGFAILPEVSKDINMVLAESILTRYDFKTGKITLVPREEYLRIAEQLQEAKKMNPNLKVFTLDYWDLNDKQGIKTIYEMQRNQGFYPYVSKITLDQLIPEP